MESAQPEAGRLIMRYLTGQLTPAESDAFERALLEQAELREQAEQVLKLKEGFARLREQGELDAVLREPARPRWLPYAAAAAVALLCLVALAWLYVPRATSSLLARSPQQLVSSTHPPPSVAATYVLARMRGAAAVTELARTGVIELRVLPSVPSFTVSYRVQLSASDRTAGTRIVGQLGVGPATADGYVTFYLDSTQLGPGDYEVLLSPTTASGAGEGAERFPIHVR